VGEGYSPVPDAEEAHHMDETTTPSLSDSDIETIAPAVGSSETPRPQDADGTDTQEGDATDGDTTDGTDGTDGDAEDADGTDGDSTDGTDADSSDADGTDAAS
jgi:hypothetical protein